MVLRTVVVSWCLLFFRTSAIASEFQLVPVRVELTTKVRTAMLKVRNHAKEELRLQVTGMAWAQEENNLLALSPTDELSIFPTLLKIGPGESRQIRVGTSAASGAFEKSYRIVIREMSPVDSSLENAVRMLTEMSVPVFFAPRKTEVSARTELVGRRGKELSFAVSNTGNVSFRVAEMRVRGLSSEGRAVFESKKQGWYVLPGAKGWLSAELPTAGCAGIKYIDVEVETDRGAFRTRFDPSSACHF